MFARFLEMTIKPEKKTEFMNKIEAEIIPMFKTYKGFLDVMHLAVETNPSKFYAMTFWHDRMDMEKYTKENFPKVNAILEPFLTAPLIVRHCTVEETITTKKFTAVAA